MVKDLSILFFYVRVVIISRAEEINSVVRKIYITFEFQKSISFLYIFFEFKNVSELSHLNYINCDTQFMHNPLEKKMFETRSKFLRLKFPAE